MGRQVKRTEFIVRGSFPFQWCVGGKGAPPLFKSHLCTAGRFLDFRSRTLDFTKAIEHLGDASN